jgi:hypothetical protein
VSAPETAFPAAANASASMLQFPGMTVDGRSSAVFPVLAASDTRY